MNHINPNPYAPLRKNWMCCRCQKPRQSMAGRRKTARGYVCVECQRASQERAA